MFIISIRRQPKCWDDIVSRALFREEMTSNIDEILCRTKNLKHKFNKKIQINKGLERLINNKNKKKFKG